MSRNSLTEIEWARIRTWMADKRRSDYESLPESFLRKLARVAKGRRLPGAHPVSRQIAREALKYGRAD